MTHSLDLSAYVCFSLCAQQTLNANSSKMIDLSYELYI